MNLKVKGALWLTHWGRMTHICIGDLTTIVSDKGLSPNQRQVINCTNAEVLLIEPLGTKFYGNFNRNSYIFIQANAVENITRKVADILSWPQCVLMELILLLFPAVLVIDMLSLVIDYNSKVLWQHHLQYLSSLSSFTIHDEVDVTRISH